MAISNFKYATHRDVKDVYAGVDKFDTKQEILGWVVDSGSRYKAENSGLVTQLYADGEDLDSAQGSSGAVISNGQWYYDSAEDQVYYYNDASDPNDMIMESGEIWATLIDRYLVSASSELNALLDGRFPRPVPRAFQYSDTPASDTPEYDYVIIRSTSLIAIAHLIRATNPISEEADAFYREVSNEDGTGLVDRINKGEIKLAFEVDRTDQSGDIIKVTETGSMALVETAGEWTGIDYDRVQIICSTTGGAYGTAKVDIKTSGNNQLYGATISDVIVTGGLQAMANGVFMRFEGNSMSVNDRWDVVVRNSGFSMTNSDVRSIEAGRV